MKTLIGRRKAFVLASTGAVVTTLTARVPNANAQRGNGVITGKVKLGEARAPKGVDCYVRSTTGSQRTGTYDDGSGEFYFANMPNGNPLHVWLLYNGKRVDFPNLSHFEPSRLEVRFPDPQQGPPEADATIIAQALASIASLAMELRRKENDNLKAQLFGKGAFGQFRQSLGELNGAINKTVADLTEMEQDYLRTAFEKTNQLWTSLG